MVSAASARIEESYSGEEEQDAMAVQGVLGSLAATSAADAAAVDDASKKIRKPYTITKSRESWTEQEHDKFLEALQLFDRDWKKIEAFVGSKTVIQIRSHAQKYFLKVQKNGTSEHVPPPRPKRKAAHPYPQKATKNASLPSHPTTAFQASSCFFEPDYAPRTTSAAVLRNSNTSGTMSSWAHSSVNPHIVHMTKDNMGPGGATVDNNCCSSSVESPPSAWLTCEPKDPGNHVTSFLGMPDFAEVYSFIGSIFDTNTSDHLQKLKDMDPVDAETVMLLMRNISMNLTSPDFEDHRKLLASYEGSSEEVQFGRVCNTLEADENGSVMVQVE